MRILVLGGAGFIGSNFVRFLAGRLPLSNILVYDKFTYAGRLENLLDLVSRGLRVVQGDIRNMELLMHVVSEFSPDVVVNFVAETHVDRSIVNAFPFAETNVIGSLTLFEVCRRLDVPLLVHISTDEVYGDLSWTSEEADESWPLRPSNPYSATKAAADLLLQAYGRTYGLKYIIVRPCNNYGPYQHPEKLIPRTIIRLLLGLPATIYGDGKQIRDWLYVEDFCDALWTIITRGRPYEIYNVSAGQYATVEEIVRLICRLLGKSERDIVYVRARPGEDRRYAMKSSKVRQLGWSPKTSLEEGLRKTVEWYVNNRWWWEPLAKDKFVTAQEPW